MNINSAMALIFILSLSISATAVASLNCTESPILYSYNENQTPIQKVVSAPRAYFYSSPKIDCKTDVFVINNDKLLKYREYDGYAYVNYINRKGLVVDGWVKKENIESDSNKGNELKYSDFSWLLNGKVVDLLGKAAPEMNDWVKKNGLTISEPDNHGYYKGFESWSTSVKDVTITISQVNQIVKKRLGYEDSYITAITFVTKDYKTERGISIGDSWGEVISKYGESDKIDPDNGCNYFQYFDMRLSFCLDNNKRIKSIIYDNYPIPGGI